MKLRKPISSAAGVALVITLILLAVITFMAVTFLVISNSQKLSAGTAQQQTVARQAAAAAHERFVADLVARINSNATSNGNGFQASLFISTNYYVEAGFTNGVLNVNNVNFDYYHDKPGTPGLGLVDQRNNLLNLFYDSRVPVYVTNRIAGTEEFRFYFDWNRNGHFDTNGMLTVRDLNGNAILTTNGTYFSNYFVGDPQWIGVLERPEFPHSPSNRFIARYCFIAVPIGNALDVNYIHNQAYNPNKATMTISGGDFFRNQGIGPWEINLAAFLTDLNSNAWPGTTYAYYPTNSTALFSGTWPAFGTTFEDAFRVYSNRLNGLNYGVLNSVSANYGPFGAFSFQNDLRDGYTAATFPLQFPWDAPTDPDLLAGRVNEPWPGSQNPNHIFNHQDWFDTNRLGRVARKLGWLTKDRISTYDTTTFQRLNEQLGTDSAPDTGKLNLNYVNIGGLRETNFVSWHDPNLGARIGMPGVPGSLIFFTNAANRILRSYPEFQCGVTDIPVWSNGVSLYTPAIHRSLQLAANLYESSTTSRFPMVFKPRFTKQANGLVTISSYEEVSTDLSKATLPMDIVALSTGTDVDANVYGVPWVIGAKKGLPNLNEIGFATRADLTRKLLITRPPNSSSPGPRWTTNLQYSLSISNSIALEAWNSYSNNFPDTVELDIRGDLVMVVTNEFGVLSRDSSIVMSNSTLIAPAPITLNNWKGYNGKEGKGSFIVPLNIGQLYLPTAIYEQPRNFNTRLTTGFDDRTDFPQPKWGINTKLRLRYMMIDRSTSPPRILDYVQIDESNRGFNLAEAVRDADKKRGLDGLWSTNLVGNSGLPQGILNQVLISLGAEPTDNEDWKGFGRWGQDGKGTKDLEIAKFLDFMFPDSASPTQAVMQVPFSPTSIQLHRTTLQVNDPFVHYLASDLRDIDVVGTNAIARVPLNRVVEYPPFENIGLVNNRYAPWGTQGRTAKGEVIDGLPDLFDTVFKDPGLIDSDRWVFPTNSTYSQIGLIGRVHRGTPWQTVYLKSAGVTRARDWQKWTGNEYPLDAEISKPASDRRLFDIFTATVDENVTRGLLPVNQTNLAAWSAVFGGVVAVSNAAAATDLYPYVVAPVSVDGPSGPMARIYSGISRTRTDTNLFPQQIFSRLGDILAVPELTDQSPYITTARKEDSTEAQRFRTGMTDPVYEWLPQQVMGLLKFTEPRYVVYAYGQALKPAPGAILTSGQFFGLCTNYQVTAEIATRSVIRVVNPNSATPGIEQENFNFLPAD